MKLRKNILIYLSDLVHNFASVGPHMIPINIGYVAAYAKKLYGTGVDIRLFKYPLDLITAMKDEHPDILGLGNYAWNLDLNKRMTELAKSLDRNVVTVFGGPDLPFIQAERVRYLKERGCLDFCVPGQGEIGFAKIIERFMECGSSEGMKRKPLENCVFLGDDGETVVSEDAVSSVDDLDDIPSPYLTGLLDGHFGMNLIPIIETTRGCPYLCTYCSWGKACSKQVRPYSIDRVREEIAYIARRVEGVDLLMLADANFGLFERDVEVARFLRASRDNAGYPRNLFVAWSKYAFERMTQMTEMLGEMIGSSNSFGSFQSLDPVVIKNIKRVNLDLQKYKEAQDYFRHKGIFLSTELILGLPGETKRSYLSGLRTLFESGAPSIYCYNLRMLGGSELNSDESRSAFGIKTKHRLVDGGYGTYDGLFAIESEEMVLETGTMSMEDVLFFRPIHFLIQFMWNYRYYAEVLNFLKSEGVNAIDFIDAVVQQRGLAPPEVKVLFESFVRESRNEWFDSRDELVERYSKHEEFDALVKAGFGKLNYLYTYKILLGCKREFDAHLRDTAMRILRERGLWDAEREEQVADIFRYIENMYLDMSTDIEAAAPVREERFLYDIPRWKRDGCDRALSDYRCHNMIRFFLPQDQKKRLANLKKQFAWADLNTTMRKMVEYMHERDLFYQVEDVSEGG